MRVLVTGNLGYVGSVMTPMLRQAGHEVWGCDVGFFEDCLFGELGDPGVARQLTKDVRRLEEADLHGVDAVVHLAALSNDPTGELDPRLTHEINFEGTMRVARLAKQAGASRFLFASSCSIYGQGGEALLTEDSPMTPLTAYAVSKVRAEAALRELADDRFSPISLRNATAYGFSPRPRFDVVVNNLTGWAVTTGEVRLMSDGGRWCTSRTCRARSSWHSRRRASSFTIRRSTSAVKPTIAASVISRKRSLGSCPTAG
jgi:nucleoside-diphosphate-sugar epimerase